MNQEHPGYTITLTYEELRLITSALSGRAAQYGKMIHKLGVYDPNLSTALNQCNQLGRQIEQARCTQDDDCDDF
jgi:hypothetical protein